MHRCGTGQAGLPVSQVGPTFQQTALCSRQRTGAGGPAAAEECTDYQSLLLGAVQAHGEHGVCLVLLRAAAFHLHNRRTHWTALTMLQH